MTFGRHVRALGREARESAERNRESGSLQRQGQRLIDLGEHLLATGRRMSAGDDDPFEPLTIEDAAVIEALAASLQLAENMLADALAKDAEEN